MTNKQRLVTYLNMYGKRDNESWEFLAKKFNLSTGEIARHAWKSHRIRRAEAGIPKVALEKMEAQSYIAQLEDTITNYQEDFKNNSAELTAQLTREVEGLDDLIVRCKIDTNKWDVTKYTQAATNNRFSVKAWLEQKKASKEGLAEKFIEFLSTYKPAAAPIVIKPGTQATRRACLVLPNQDGHMDKHDVNGDNNMEERFDELYVSIDSILKDATATHSLDAVIYVLGSDQFNSEWTGMTTKGTPQKNLVDFHEGFEAICNHEIRVINRLREYADEVNIVFVSGNHDEYVGWHLVKWLEAYYRNDEHVVFDTDKDYRKYTQYGSSLMMFNHGDAMKPEKLAATFPMEARDAWSDADHYYIFTGDKHNMLSKDINGIQFYQIPSTSKAKSNWDEKQGHTTNKAEMTAFLISEEDGLKNILKEFLG